MIRLYDKTLFFRPDAPRPCSLDFILQLTGTMGFVLGKKNGKFIGLSETEMRALRDGCVGREHIA